MTIDSVQKLYLPGFNKLSPTPQLEIDLIIADVLKVDLSIIYSSKETKLTKTQENEVVRKLNERLKRVPLAYILKEKEFFGNVFQVNESVLIPRPETEILVIEGLKLIKLYKKEKLPLKVIDVGTGSGCIMISIAKAILNDHSFLENDVLSSIEFVGTDISKSALEVAKINANKILTRSNMIKFVNEDLIEKEKLEEQTIVIANLPYIPSQNLLGLEEEVKKEPMLALDGGKSGAEVIIKLLNQVKKKKFMNLTLLLEIYEDQSDYIINKATEIFNRQLHSKIIKDQYGVERFVKFEITKVS